MSFLAAYGDESSRETFSGELNYQSGILFALVFIGIFAWLPYIPIDWQIHQFPTMAVALRLGFTIVCICAILARFTKTFRHRPKAILSFGVAYLYYATALKAATAGPEISAYIGGFVFIIMLPIFLPISLKFKIINTIASIFMFYTLGYFFGVDFASMSIMYSVADLIVVMVVSVIFSFGYNGLQYRAWRQRVKLSETINALSEARLTNLMIDTAPLCSQLWDSNLNTIDCNEAAVRLYGFRDKNEYLERFLRDCSPEYQPDGRRSDEKAQKLVSQTFAEGRTTFDWMHQMPDGTPMPAEVTLVRVVHKGDYFVVGYTRDLRDIARLEAEAEKIYYDGLTGIYNRRYFDEKLPQVIKTLAATNGVLSLMMVDIDFFKDYNDNYGHSAGDICLKIVAKTLSESVTRTNDFVARFGGEEFAVVLPNTNEDGARYVAGKMLADIRRHNIPHEKSSAADCVTFSVGIATGRVKEGLRGEDYVEMADEMLYKSKQGGRNKFTLGTL
ncbi:MAG: diguanylate cyclase [Clostridiales bacterium]|jgi:diguanylate cyclase (GGDEF)-like protein|nr:diguanylate cyclase [Clostridiales bacterium]